MNTIKIYNELVSLVSSDGVELNFKISNFH